MAFPNKGIVSVEGEEQKVIVKNAIEGQKIRFSINKKKKRQGRGKTLRGHRKVPASDRRRVCLFQESGGCMYQGVPYQEQLKIKETQVKNLLAPVLLNAGYELDEIFEGVKESPRSLAYRNKMEFSFGDEVKDGPLSLGMHKRGSFHDIVTVDGCRIVDEDYSKILRGVLDFFTEHQVPFYHKMSHVGYLRHLLVRKAVKTGEILIDLVTTTQPIEGADIKELLSEMAATICALELEGTVVGILHTENDV